MAGQEPRGGGYQRAQFVLPVTRREVWFHRPVDPSRWLLYAQQSPSAQGGRGLGIGTVFAEDGTLVATIAQEGMIRVREDAGV